MSAVVLRAPRAELSHGPGRSERWKPDENAIAIRVTQPASSDASWILSIYAIGEHSRSLLGTVTTSPPGPGRASNRLVAIAQCPGTRTWVVEARPAGGPDGLDELLEEGGAGGWLSVEGCEPMLGGCCAIIPLDGSQLGGYGHGVAAAPGVIAVPAGAWVRSWTVIAAAAGQATLDIGYPPFLAAQPQITIPAGASLSDALDRGELGGPVTFTLAGDVVSAVVRWARGQ